MIKERDFKKIIKAFNFDKVKVAMDAVDWNYNGDPVTIEELKNMAWCLYETCDDWNCHERVSMSSGGFTLKKPHGAKYLNLSFCVEEYGNEYEGVIHLEKYENENMDY